MIIEKLYLSLLLAFGTICVTQAAYHPAMPVFGAYLLLTVWMEWRRPKAIFRELKTIQHFVFLIAMAVFYLGTDRGQGIDEGIGIAFYIFLQSILIYHKRKDLDLEGLHMDKAVGCVTLFAALNWPVLSWDLPSIYLAAYGAFYFLLFFWQGKITSDSHQQRIRLLLNLNNAIYGILLLFTVYKIIERA